jgi:hypothetical protein
MEGTNMLDLPTILYFFAVAGGAVILGAAIAYGFARNKQRTAAEKRATEAGTHRIYEKEEREA